MLTQALKNVPQARSTAARTGSYLGFPFKALCFILFVQTKFYLRESCILSSLLRTTRVPKPPQSFLIFKHSFKIPWCLPAGKCPGNKLSAECHSFFWNSPSCSLEVSRLLLVISLYIQGWNLPSWPKNRGKEGACSSKAYLFSCRTWCLNLFKLA